MSYLSVSQQGYLIAEQSQQAYINETMRAYDQALKEIDALLEKQYATLSGVSSDKYYNEVLKYDRLKKLSDSIAKAYNKNAIIAGKETIKGLGSAMTVNYNRQSFLTEWLATTSFVPLNEDLLKYAITGNINIWKKIQSNTFEKIWGDPKLYSPQAGTLTSLLSKNKVAGLEQILQTVENGFITGKSYSQQTLSISEIIGKYSKTTAGEAATGLKYKALRIARTEGQRVLNDASLASSYAAKSQGVNIKKQWIAALDNITRTSHRALDGQRRELEEVFTSPTTGATGQAPLQMSSAGDNINCRCSTIDIIDDQEPSVRRARDPISGKNEMISFKNYDTWAKGKGVVSKPYVTTKKTTTKKNLNTEFETPVKKTTTAKTNISGKYDIDKISTGAKTNFQKIADIKGVNLQDAINKANEYSNKYPRRVLNIDTLISLL